MKATKKQVVIIWSGGFALVGIGSVVNNVAVIAIGAALIGVCCGAELTKEV